MTPFKAINLLCLVINLQEKVETTLAVEFFYINNQLQAGTIKIENLSYIEILTIKLAIHKIEILVTGIYKPPKLSEADYTTSLATIIS